MVVLPLENHRECRKRVAPLEECGRVRRKIHRQCMEGLGGGTCHSPKALPLNDESGKDLAVFHQGNSEDIPLTKN